MTDYIVVYVTAPEGEAAYLAKTLVEERLVACVNIVPGLRSIYWWQGKIEDEPEVLCMHSYEVEEIIALPILAGNIPYLEWIKENTQK